MDRVAGDAARRLLQPALLQGRRRAGRAARAGNRALRVRGRRTLGAAEHRCCSSTWTWRASEGAEVGCHLRPGDRPAGGRRAGAGARLLETEGYFEADVRIEQTVAPPACRISSSPSCPARGCGCEASPSTRPRRWRRARRRARSPGPTGWKSCAGPGASSPARPSARPTGAGPRTRPSASCAATGYPTATWQSTRARIDASERTAALAATLAPGAAVPPGAGADRRHPPLRRDRGAQPGDLSPRRRLQRQGAARLPGAPRKIGLFEGARVELDATGPPEAAPVIVRVKEQSQHQATFGIGYSANTGGRVSLEHWDRSSVRPALDRAHHAELRRPS